MASHRKREICKERKKVITSSERDEDREVEKPGPSTEDSSEEVDLYEDLALEDSDDSDEEEGVIVEEDTIVL